MIVITVITADEVPVSTYATLTGTALVERFALSLESELINRFTFSIGLWRKDN